MKSRRARCDDVTAEFPFEDINQTIARRFEQQARKYPGRLAVRHHGFELTYRELNGVANRVAYSVLKSAAPAMAPVAILCSSAAATIVGALGVLKAGQAFAPVDGRMPPVRLKQILARLQAPVVLTDCKYAGLARRLAGKAVRIIEVDPANDDLVAEDPRVTGSPDTLAYVNFTSGSTGAPKGVMWNHRSELFGIRTKTLALGIAASDRISLLRAHNVGAARDMFLALLNGAALVSCDLDDAALASLGPWLRRERITVFSCVATIFRQALRDAKNNDTFPAVRLIHIGGEPLYRADIELYRRYFSDQCRFVARYSISETQAVSYYFVDKRTALSGDRVPVGYLLDGNEVTILDDNGRAVGAGVTGEIAVRSPYLAAGYWRDQKSTRKKFLVDPGGVARRYLTGDLGYLLDDGCLVHVGRKDFQVKIRGHRVEMAAVERALHGIAAIRQAAVMSDIDRSGKANLVAYLELNAKQAPDIQRWRAHLRDRLPAYMVPSKFVVLTNLPVGVGGKLDRRALAQAPRKSRATAKSTARPRRPIEIVLARFWSDALEVAAVGIRDDFITLGGDSLQAAQIVARIHELFPLRTRLTNLPSTIEEAAGFIMAHENASGHSEKIAAAFLHVEAMSSVEVAAARREPRAPAGDG